MKTGICIVIAGALIAGAILITNRYTIGEMHLGAREQYIYGIDSWSGEPFVKTKMYDD